VIASTSAMISVYVPIVVAIITAIVAPLWIARRKSHGDLSVGLIEDQAKLRKDLWERIENLEARLDKAAQEMKDAFDQVRSLQSANERCVMLIDQYRAENERLRERMRAIDGKINGDSS
jgi:uncharacterized coiled-coil DUF342 family protein